MYHIRLCKGLSYCGVVSATRKEPDVFVEDKATADVAVASGYFRLMDGGEESAGGGQTLTGNLDRGQLEEMKVDDLKRLAEDMGIETKGLKKAQLVEAIAGEEVELDAEGDAGDGGAGASTGTSESDNSSEGEADYGEED